MQKCLRISGDKWFRFVILEARNNFITKKIPEKLTIAVPRNCRKLSVSLRNISILFSHSAIKETSQRKKLLRHVVIASPHRKVPDGQFTTVPTTSLILQKLIFYFIQSRNIVRKILLSTKSSHSFLSSLTASKVYLSAGLWYRTWPIEPATEQC